MPDIAKEKPTVKLSFDPTFIKSIDLLLTMYQNSLGLLDDIVKNPTKHINDMYGICNNGYKLRYVTPHDVSTFVSYLGKIVKEEPFPIENLNDIETIATSMIQQFVNDNEKCIPFENTTIFANGTHPTQRTMNLSMLMLICDNEFYDTNVYSKSDMINRAMALRYDVNLMDTLRFPLNMRKLIAKIPSVLEDYCGEILGGFPVKQKATMEILQRFLITVATINVSSVKGMMGYCIPRVYYNAKCIKDDLRRKDYDYYPEYTVKYSDGIVTEAVDMSKNKPVFISLSTGDGSFVSRTIKNVTGENFSHSSISFDPEMNEMYTFNGAFGNDDVYGIQKPGLQRESLHSSKFNNIPVRVYCVFVPTATYEKMKGIAEDLEKQKPGYDYMAIAKRWRAISSGDPLANPARGDNSRQVCSTFVNSLLSVAGDPLGTKEITSPGELDKAAAVRPSEVFKVYDGPGGEYDGSEALQKLKNIAADEESMAYASNVSYAESYYTECCLLRTNTMRIRSKIPFNCNMRDIVLQDMHPEFKDTKSALMFMVTDPRSPITPLVRKYRTVERMQPVHRAMNMFAHLRHAYSSDMRSEANSDNFRNQLGMHTDVNWLDKITYGNQFLDGNYRADALGNNKFNPMEETLSHLYAMYCCEALKSNEDLANNIVEVTNLMSGIIDSYVDKTDGCVYNWEMVRDILAVLGEILTRSMLKLYHNNTTVISISDDIGDGEAPGYMYTESFEMFLEEAGPSVKVTSNKTGANKVIGNVKMVLSKFIRWITQAFGGMSQKFNQMHENEIKWVESHGQLNTDIGNALGQNGFEITLNNYKKFQINMKGEDSLIKRFKIKDIIDKTLNGEKGYDTDAASIARNMAKNAIQGFDVAPSDSLDEYKKIILNQFLYGQNSEAPVKTVKLDKAAWDEITKDLTSTMKAVQIASKQMMDDLKAAAADMDKAYGTQTNVENKQESYFDLDLNSKIIQEVTEGDGTNNDVDKKKQRAEELSKSLPQISSAIYLTIINAINDPFYKTTYKLYRDIVGAYKSQYEAPQTNASQQANANTTEETGADAGATGADAGAGNV